MSFSVRSRDEIRDDLIAALVARYSSAGYTLDVSEGSDAYLRADALAVVLAPIEQQAAAQVRDTFVDTASEEGVRRHAAQFGIVPRAALACELLIEFTGAPSIRRSVDAGTTLESGASRVTVIDSVLATDSSGIGFVRVRSNTPGTAGAIDVGKQLAWSSPPTGMDPTATVSSVLVAAEDEESVDRLRARVMARLRQRPASGNVEEWREAAEDCDGVDAAFVYPLLQPPGVSGDTLGCVSVVVLGPPQGDSPTNTRAIASERTAEIKSYIEGNVDAHGEPDPDAIPRYPAAMSADDFDVFSGGATVVQVEIQVKNSPRYAFPFSGSLTITGVPTATQIEVLGNHAAKTGSRVLVSVGTSLVRGGWQAVTLGNGTYDGVSKTTFQVALLGAPDLNDVYPAPSNWEAMRLEVFALFDSLGPRDTTPARRWPSVDVSHPDTVYRGALQAAVLRATGVVSASVVLPATDFVPSDAKQLATLDTLLITEAP